MARGTVVNIYVKAKDMDVLDKAQQEARKEDGSLSGFLLDAARKVLVERKVIE